jgi:NADH dehydrogenase FAD-containing subunit
MDYSGYSQSASQASVSIAKKPLAILGEGFGGVYSALRLEKTLGRYDAYEVTLVIRDKYFLFTATPPKVAGDLDLDTMPVLVSTARHGDETSRVAI